MMCRWMCNVTLKDRKSSEELRERLGVKCVSDVVRCERLRWFGHAERKSSEDCASACRSLKVDGVKGRGRPRKTWNECVGDDLKELGLNKELCKDREG